MNKVVVKKKEMAIKNSQSRQFVAIYLKEFKKTRSISETSKTLNIPVNYLYSKLHYSRVFNNVFNNYKSYSHKEHNVALMWAKKIAAIKYLGGKCKKCGNSNIFHLSFHHIDPKIKEDSIRHFFKRTWYKIVKELNKCILLCKNCHQELHFIKNYEIKQDILKIAGEVKCKKCNYSSKHLSSLTFHHRDKKDKEFQISDFCNYKNNKFRKDYLKTEIENEIKKCDILCMNCHSLEHNNIKEFDRLSKLISNKVTYTIPFSSFEKKS